MKKKNVLRRNKKTASNFLPAVMNEVIWFFGEIPCNRGDSGTLRTLKYLNKAIIHLWLKSYGGQ